MTIIDFNAAREARSPVRSKCPDCSGRLTVLQIIAGRASSEYWTMRCTSCGGIHLDIVNPRHPAPAPEHGHDNAPAA